MGNLFIDPTDGNVKARTTAEGRLSKTIQAHNAVNVGATSGTVSSNWFDCSGYESVSLTFMNDAATNNSIALDWSHDGVTLQGAETPLATSTSKFRAATVPVKARYARVTLNNTDAAVHVMSAWIMLRT